HLQDLAVMRQAVQQRRGHPFPLEDLAPLAERQVARHQHAAALIAVAEDAEQQFDSATAQADVAQLVDDQQVRPFELAKEPVERVLLLLLLELADQLRRREELDPQARATRRQTTADRNMCLASSMTPDEATVGFLCDPFTTPQLQHHGLGEARQRRE